MAQDPAKVAPDIYKVLFENDRVRALDVNLKLGKKAGLLRHPDHIAYLTTSAKLKFTSPSGKIKEVEANAGQVVWIDAGAHSTENIGITDAHALIIELKEPRKK